jgi:hypothetical protein
MRTFEGYHVGHLEGSVRSLVLGMTERIAVFEYAVVRSVDSNTELSGWKPRAKLRHGAVDLGGALLISGNDVVEMARSGDFTGFDEVWFMNARPLTPPPLAAALVGPYDLEVDDVHEAVGWAAAQSCEMAFGDGIGLNYLARTEELAARICQTLGGC